MHVFNDANTLDTARRFKNELALKIFARPYYLDTQEKNDIILPPTDNNIVGYGYGLKETNGIIQKQICVRVYVRKKYSNSELSNWQKVPPDVNGLPSDVIEIGNIYAMGRPIECGTSISHYKVSAGTLGCLVQCHTKQEELYILSNNHVLANANNGNKGDKILQPSLYDGGNENNPIAYLEDFELIKFGWDNLNIMDAAIARIVNHKEVDPKIATIGYLQEPVGLAELEQYVCKYGRTTEYTTGFIEGISEDIIVNFYGKCATFVNQLAIKGENFPFSKSGDSGSLIVDAQTRQPVALLFAGDEKRQLTFANPISPILTRFNVKILGEKDLTL